MPILRILLLTAALTSQLWGQTRAKTFFEIIPPSAITGSAVDNGGNIYVTGVAAGDILPVTANAFQPKFVQVACPGFGGPTLLCQHAFVAKISADGTKVLYATYLEGGTGADLTTSIAVDSSGNAYVTGNTTSKDFPLTPGAYQRTPGEAFVTKLNATGSALLGSTYISGVSPQAIVVDASGNAYITGSTTNISFATTPGAFQTLPQGTQDAFILKLDSNLHAALYATYLGGGLTDLGWAIAVDAQGNAYITGSTTSILRTGIVSDPNPTVPFPTTPGAFGHPQTNSDVFISKLNTDGSKLLFSSVIGGGGVDTGLGIAVDTTGAVYVSGVTTSLDLPVSLGSVPAQGTGFALKLSADASKLLYLTYLSGPSSAIVPPRFQVALNGDHFIIRSYSENLVITTPDSPNPCRLLRDVTGDRSGQEFVTELTSAGTTPAFATYLHYTVALTGDSVWTAALNDASHLLVQTPLNMPITAHVTTCAGNAATFLSGPLVPGEIASVFGANIGVSPALTAQLDTSGKVATTLGGITVQVNGRPAPLLYVSSSQINMVIPFEIAGSTSAQLQVFKNGIPLNPLSFEVGTATPGVFAIVNANGSVNDAAHPALLGTTVAIFGTGAGLMTPAAITGSLGAGKTAIVNRVSANLRTVDSFIDPNPAKSVALDVSYAGDAPGSVQGLVQINTKLPANFTLGRNLLDLSIGGATLQPIPIYVTPRPD